MSSDNNRKKSGADAAKASASDQASQKAAPRKDVQSVHGNQQVGQVIKAQPGQKQAEETPMLQAAENEQIAGSEQAWWADKSAAQEEEAQMLKAPGASAAAAMLASTTASPRVQPTTKGAEAVVARRESVKTDTKAKADRDAKRGRRLSPQEEAKELELKKAAMAAGLFAANEQDLLRSAEAAGYDEDDKAEMLIAQGQAIDATVLAAQSGEVQTLLAAENMPAAIADLDRDAARDAKESPLNEHDTIRNVTEHIQLISQRIESYPDLASPNLSVEEKATKLVQLMAYEMDVPTRESLSSHSFVGLVEDLVFDPQCMLEINRISGGDRNVRTMGSFAAVLWQHTVDAVQNKLKSLPNDERIHESQMLGGVFKTLSQRMYTDALMKPPTNVA